MIYWKPLIYLAAVAVVAVIGAMVYNRDRASTDDMGWEYHSGGYSYQNWEHGMVRKTVDGFRATEVFIPCKNYENGHIVSIPGCDYKEIRR